MISKYLLSFYLIPHNRYKIHVINVRGDCYSPIDENEYNSRGWDNFGL